MIQTRLTKLLDIKYPIIQGGMAWVAESTLAAAVSNVGGLGLIAGGSAPKEVVAAEIDKARRLTDKPFGLNIMLMSPNAGDLVELAIEKKVKVVTTGAGSPGKYMEPLKEAGIIVMPVVPSANLAKRVERMGADAVIAEGCEAGGHIGELTTMAMIPQVVDAVDIPVIAAGGIADGRGLAAALMLGADGIQCGTCFLVADECQIHENYKQEVLGAGDTGTVVTGRSHGHPVRSIKNKLTRQYAQLERGGAGFEELEEMALGGLRKAVQEGDQEGGSFMAGQIAGMIRQKATCQEIIDHMFTEAHQAMQARLSLWK